VTSTLSCAKSTEYYLNEFFSRNRAPNESIAAYCYRVQELIDLAMPGLAQQSREQMLKSRLVTNVPAHVKAYMEMVKDCSWSKLFQLFDKTADFDEVKSEPSDVTISLNRLTASPKARKSFNGNCYICQQPGHRARDCRSNNGSSYRPRPLTSRDKNKEETLKTSSTNHDSFGQNVGRPFSGNSRKFGGNKPHSSSSYRPKRYTVSRWSELMQW
jgi:hypothetical protein